MQFSRFAAVASAAVALSLGGAAQASTWIATGSGSDGAVKAQADIISSSNQLIITLTDLLANPTSAGQEVSGIEIFFADKPTSASLSKATGTLINITAGKKGAANTWSVDTTDTINHWGTAISGNALYLATAGTGAKGGSPVDLIIDGGGNYSNANASIAGHGPEIKGAGVFTLALTGETNPVITGVSIEFGTKPELTLAATCTASCAPAQIQQVQTPIPEPATWGLMIGGFFGAGSILRARRKALRAA